MNVPLFSAAYVSQLQNLANREQPNLERIAEPRWKRVQGGETDRNQWGYYLELAPPVVPDVQETRAADKWLRDVVANGEEVRRLHVTAAGKSTTMTVKKHTWISLWFLITVPVIFWDVGYCFMRPRSMKGGDLHWMWKPYEIYQDVDLVYGVKALQEGNGFTNAQSLLNVIETLMNIAYLYLTHISPSPSAIIIGFAAAVMTLSKTILYWAQEYYCGYCAVGHNSVKDLLVFWILPNGLWIVVPSLIVRQFGKDLSASLLVADRATKKAALGKIR